MAAQAAENFSNQAANTREPSMEEILASIRRIIEDSDGRPELPYDKAANAAGSPHQPANTQPTQKIETVTSQAEAPVVDSSRVVPTLSPPAATTASQLQPAARIEQPSRSATPALPAEAPKSSILSDVAGRQVAAAFGELSEAFAATRRRSFDEIAEEMMRPMLQEWLDDNLPTLVERLVREEIERIARVGSR